MDSLLGLAPGPELALVLGVVALGGFMRGFVGFGAALVVVPVLSLALGPLVAVPVSSLVALPGVLQLLPTAVRHCERPIVVPVAVSVFLAAPLGAWALVRTDPELMKIVIAALVVVLTAFLARGWRLRGEVRTSVLVGAGVAGGLIQGGAGIGGPPVVAVALSRPGTAAQQRANVLGVMTAIAMSSLAPLAYHGLYTRQVLAIAAVLWPLNALSIWAGTRYFSGRGQHHFRIAALAILGAIGCGTLAAALRGYLQG